MDAGMLLPIFSLPSPSGKGDFLQAEANINFLRAAGVSGGEFYRFHDKFPRPGMG